MTKLEFFFDYSSPWTYLGFTGLQPLIARSDVELHWRPILLGGVFNAVNPQVYESRAKPNPRRERYYRKDLADWCRYYGLTLNWPDIFPVNSVKAMRGALVAIEENCLVLYSQVMFEAYWRDNRDIADDDVLTEIINSAQMEPDKFFEKISHPDYKQTLRDNTQNLIDRDGFGSPTLFIDDEDMCFGNDRLVLVEKMLEPTTSTVTTP